MNRKERRRLRRKVNQKAAAEMKDQDLTDHATVMVMNQPPWTSFQRRADLDNDAAISWVNSRYLVSLYPPEVNSTLEGWPKVVHLSFKHHANVAITDFRDMQAIKNELVGKQSFCVQIFPPEEHLVDGANQYHLWCLVPDSWPEVSEDEEWPALPLGFTERMVNDSPLGGGRQRTFEEHNAPTEKDREEWKKTREKFQRWKEKQK